MTTVLAIVALVVLLTTFLPTTRVEHVETFETLTSSTYYLMGGGEIVTTDSLSGVHTIQYDYLTETTGTWTVTTTTTLTSMANMWGSSPVLPPIILAPLVTLIEESSSSFRSILWGAIIGVLFSAPVLIIRHRRWKRRK